MVSVLHIRHVNKIESPVISKNRAGTLRRLWSNGGASNAESNKNLRSPRSMA